jgi:hypothetical protein
MQIQIRYGLCRESKIETESERAREREQVDNTGACKPSLRELHASSATPAICVSMNVLKRAASVASLCIASGYCVTHNFSTSMMLHRKPSLHQLQDVLEAYGIAYKRTYRICTASFSSKSSYGWFHLSCNRCSKLVASMILSIVSRNTDAKCGSTTNNQRQLFDRAAAFDAHKGHWCTESTGIYQRAEDAQDAR